jgi:hypothetical protein
VQPEFTKPVKPGASASAPGFVLDEEAADARLPLPRVAALADAANDAALENEEGWGAVASAVEVADANGGT